MKLRSLYRSALTSVILTTTALLLVDVVSCQESEVSSDWNMVQPAQTTPAGWWSGLVASPMRRTSIPRQYSLDEVIVLALEHSSEVEVLSDLPMIRHTAIIEPGLASDWSTLISKHWRGHSDSVSSSLAVGNGETSFISEQWNRRGVDVSHIGMQAPNSNSLQINPKKAARLVLGYTRPLVRGPGVIHNESLNCLTKLDGNITNNQFRQNLEAQLLEITLAYWALYHERSVLFQKMNSYKWANEISKILETQETASNSQTRIAGAKALSAKRHAELINARAAVKNAEAGIRSLVNAPEMGAFDEIEIIPVDSPSTIPFQALMSEAMEFAIQNRPEVLQTIKQIKAEQSRSGVSKYELFSELNLTTQAYVSGIPEDDSSTPGRRNHLHQLKSQYATTLQTVKKEVEVAVREVGMLNQEMNIKQGKMDANSAQLTVLTNHWKQLPSEDPSSSLALEDALVSQQQLAQSEFEFLQSQLAYSLSLLNLKRTTGLLLRTEAIQPGETIAYDFMPSTMPKQNAGSQTRFQSTAMTKPKPASQTRFQPTALSKPKTASQTRYQPTAMPKPKTVSQARYQPHNLSKLKTVSQTGYQPSVLTKSKTASQTKNQPHFLPKAKTVPQAGNQAGSQCNCATCQAKKASTAVQKSRAVSQPRNHAVSQCNCSTCQAKKAAVQIRTTSQAPAIRTAGRIPANQGRVIRNETFGQPEIIELQTGSKLFSKKAGKAARAVQVSTTSQAPAIRTAGRIPVNQGQGIRNETFGQPEIFELQTGSKLFSRFK